jgi:hypothetical protein
VVAHAIVVVRPIVVAHAIVVVRPIVVVHAIVVVRPIVRLLVAHAIVVVRPIVVVHAIVVVVVSLFFPVSQVRAINLFAELVHGNTFCACEALRSQGLTAHDRLFENLGVLGSRGCGH